MSEAQGNWQIKLSLFLNYFLFAILLNSVGIVILQVQNNFGVTESQASVLEGYKDLTIAVVSFFVAAYMLRIGYKRAMLIALGIIAIICGIMPSIPSFWATKLLFFLIGVSFAFIKVSVFATISLVTADEKEHISFMSFIESIFMVGVMAGYLLIFPFFMDEANPASTEWFKVYYLLSGLAIAAFLLLYISELDESVLHEENKKSELIADMVNMFKVAIKRFVLIFIVSAFLYVLIEQGIMSWLPTFNQDILQLPSKLSVQMASILAASTAIGRFLSGIISKRVPWFTLVVGCLVGAAALIFLALPLAQNIEAGSVTSWLDAPLAAYVFPLIGLFLAPIYPAINSTILSSLPAEKHGPMSGLIVVFSALGGTTGSIITGNLFEHLGGQTAFYFVLLPITLLLITLFFFNRKTKYAGLG